MMQLYHLPLWVKEKQSGLPYKTNKSEVYICILCYDLDKQCCSSRPVLRDLVNRVLPHVAVKWYELGLELLDPANEHELEIIEKDAKDDAKMGCRKMFKKWLDSDEEASWEKVIQALTDIELDEVASDIEERLMQGRHMCR